MEKEHYRENVYFAYTIVQELAGTVILSEQLKRISNHKILNLIAAYGLSSWIVTLLRKNTLQDVYTNKFIQRLIDTCEKN